MRRKVTMAMAAAISALLLNLPIAFLRPLNVSTFKIYALALSPTAIASPTPTVSQSAGGLDPAIIAALIALGAAILVALITGAFALYQLRRNTKAQEKLLLYQKELEKQYKRQEQDEQRKETDAEAARIAMLRANTLAERIAAYRKGVQADPRIARLQILDMNRPLAVTDIFIRVRLHSETKSGFELDPALLDAERERNPNSLLKLGRLRLESRVSAALAPEDAIRSHKQCVVVGDPGAGKTTLLKYLTLQAVNGQLKDLPDLPIHIELNAFASSGHRNLLEFAAEVWEERYGFPRAEALEYMQAQLRDGKALLLLDALDETMAGTTKEQAEESYAKASRAITNLATYEVPIAVTARKAGYHQRPRLDGFTELEVLDFRHEDIQQFVTRWFACHPDPQKQGNASDLNNKLERSPRIQALAANPLLLSLIVIVYEDQLDLPERRAELYKQCVDTLLTKWDTSRNIRRRREFKPEHKRQLLEEVAWHFHLQGQRYFPESELLAVIARFLPAVGLPAEQNSQVLDEIAAENGLLKEQARGWHGFLHLTLQEYFAAQYAVDHQQLAALMPHRDDPWWEEVFLLYAGRIPDASPLLERLLGLSQAHDLFHTDLLLAGHCLASHPTVRQALLREQVISRLFQLLTTSPYSLTQKQAAERLAEIGGTNVSTQLLALLSNEHLHSSVRGSIAEALGQLGERSIIPQLLALLSNEHLDSDVRGSIAAALKKLIDDQESVRNLATLLLTSDIADDIHETLWTVSRQVGVRIFIVAGPQGKEVKLVKLPPA